MRRHTWVPGFLLLASLGCAPNRHPGIVEALEAATRAAAGSRPEQTANAQSSQAAPGEWLGFDRNDYPGDDSMSTLHNTFAFTGFWLTNPPGETANSWTGKRATLAQQRWGFLVLANGRLDAEILKARKAGIPPADLGRKDAATALASAQKEGFPTHTLIFLDQEEGGRLLDEQAGYLLGWTEAVAVSGFRPGVYASGQQVEDSPGQKINTVEDLRARVKAGHLHPVAIFDALDQCPPAPGCTLHPKSLSALPDHDVIAWQYAQSPRRPEITQSCGSTYSADGNCYAPGSPKLFLDMNVASSPDPSNGR